MSPVIIEVCLTTLSVLLVWTTGEPCQIGEFNPCADSNIIGDPSRHPSFFNRSLPPKNDYNLARGWYRTEIDGQPVDLTDRPPSMGHCQATQPMWLCQRGPVSGSTSEATVCTVYQNNTEYRRHSICVENCGTFNVFYLKMAVNQLERYCFGSIDVDITTNEVELSSRKESGITNPPDSTSEGIAAEVITSQQLTTLMDMDGLTSTMTKYKTDQVTKALPSVVCPPCQLTVWHVVVGVLSLALIVCLGIIIACVILRRQDSANRRLDAHTYEKNVCGNDDKRYEHIYAEPVLQVEGYPNLPRRNPKQSPEELDNNQNDSLYQVPADDLVNPGQTILTKHGQSMNLNQHGVYTNDKLP